MELIVHQPAVSPGDSITGVLRVPDEMAHRGFRLELVAVEIGRGRRRIDVMTKVTLPANGSNSIAFVLPVPNHLGPGFVTDHGSRTWAVRGIVDRRTKKDPVVEAPIDIVAPTSGIEYDQLPAAKRVEELLKQAAKHRQMYWAAPLYGGMIPTVLLAICAIPFWLSSENGSGKIAAYCLGGAALFLLGTLWMASGIVGRRLPGAKIEQVPAGARRGTPIEVSVTVTTDEPLVLSFATEEITTIQTAGPTVGSWDADASGHNGTYGSVKRTQLVSEFLAEQSTPLAIGSNNVLFLIPPNAALTYPGLFFRIEHSIQVRRAKDVGNQSRRIRKSKRYVVVIA